MSVLPLKADMRQREWHVRYVPEADIAASLKSVAPRNLIHSWATDTDDPTVEPRWGKVGKQKIVDEGPLAPGPNTGRTNYGGDGEGVGAAKYDMTTFDKVLVQHSIDFMKKAKADGKPLTTAPRHSLGRMVA